MLSVDEGGNVSAGKKTLVHAVYELGKVHPLELGKCLDTVVVLSSRCAYERT